MAFEFSLGLLIGLLIAGASFVIGVSQCIGTTILALTVIWGFLFVNPKSPVRKYWWSVSDKLVITTSEEPGYKPKINEYVSIWVELITWSGITVDRVVMKIGRKAITSPDWKSHSVIHQEHKFHDFKRPTWLNAGKHRARLIAYTPEGYSKSREFMIEVRDIEF